MAKPPTRRLPNSSAGVGVTGGTGFAGLVLLMHDSWERSVLLILAPAITVLLSSLWKPFTQEIDMRVADWRIASQRKRAEGRLKALVDKGGVDAAVLSKAKLTVDALTLLEVEIAHQRAQAILAE